MLELWFASTSADASCGYSSACITKRIVDQLCRSALATRKDALHSRVITTRWSAREKGRRRRRERKESRNVTLAMATQKRNTMRMLHGIRSRRAKVCIVCGEAASTPDSVERCMTTTIAQWEGWPYFGGHGLGLRQRNAEGGDDARHVMTYEMALQ